MVKKTCQIILVGHNWQKLIFSIDKEVFDKLIFVSETKELPGSQKAYEALKNLMNEYQRRRVHIENRRLNFHIPTKPIAELTHLIYQQKLLGFENIIVNISGSLRYIDIWTYIAASITESKMIHGDFIYEGDIEVGIHKNDELNTIYLGSITSKQVEFLELFFKSYTNSLEFFNIKHLYDENPLLNNIKSYKSIEEVRTSLIKNRGEKLTRGSINGFIKKLMKISALELRPARQNKKNISVSYIGIAFFLKEMFNLIK